MRRKKPGNPLDPEWEEAKRLCALSDPDVRKAKEVGLAPASLLLRVRSSGRASVAVWIGQLHDRMLARSARKRARAEARAPLEEDDPRTRPGSTPADPSSHEGDDDPAPRDGD